MIVPRWPSFLVIACALASAQGTKRSLPELSAGLQQRIVVVDERGRVLRALGDGGGYSVPSISPDGKRVAVIRSGNSAGESHVWIYSVATGRGVPITRGARLRSSPVWSPDGSQLAFLVGSTLYRTLANGSGQETAMRSLSQMGQPILHEWSHTGRLLVSVGTSLFAVPLRRDEAVREWKDAADGHISPDGRFLAFTSRRAGQEGVYVELLGVDTAAVRVSQGVPSRGIFWRSDSQILYYVSQDSEPALTAVEISTDADVRPVVAPYTVFAFPLPPAGAVSGNGRLSVFITQAP